MISDSMIDFIKVIDYSIAGFGSGAIAYGLLSVASSVSTAVPPIIGPAMFGALTLLGVVGGVMAGRQTTAKAEVDAKANAK